uniref:Zinc finger CCCH domain-containing protein 15 homolog n=2 Tax=Bursaphelenchus xylophilus TaxID=6326 RepID=A0A1I7SE83_BURXY
MQKFIKQLENQVKPGDPRAQQKKKKEEVDDLKDLSKIFKPVQTMPKISADVDPKSVLCVFFKQGMCTKGKKCKFSHDLAVQQKTAKRNLYVDSRDIKKDEEEETNENWDEKQLNDVAEKKHGEKDRKRPNQTSIVCKYFLEAVEEAKYGWFWECPNGEKCIYRHALPEGYILKKDRKKMEEQKRLEQISLEELIEKERAQLAGKAQTKVTLETFIAWKKKKLRERKEQAAADEKRKKANFKSGQRTGLSGRELFTYDPQAGGDDDEDAEDVAIERENEDPNEKVFAIDERTFYNIGEEGAYLDDDLDEPQSSEKPKEAEKEETKPLVFDESVFNAEEDLPSDLEEDEDEDDDQPGSSGLNADPADAIKDKLKI